MLLVIPCPCQGRDRMSRQSPRIHRRLRCPSDQTHTATCPWGDTSYVIGEKMMSAMMRDNELRYKLAYERLREAVATIRSQPFSIGITLRTEGYSRDPVLSLRDYTSSV